MGQLEPIKPPLGGPELECSFAYRELKIEHLLKLVPTIYESGFVLDSERVFVQQMPTNSIHQRWRRVETVEILWPVPVKWVLFN